jgi:hypothetical protein
VGLQGLGLVEMQGARVFGGTLRHSSSQRMRTTNLLQVRPGLCLIYIQEFFCHSIHSGGGPLTHLWQAFRENVELAGQQS